MKYFILLLVSIFSSFTVSAQTWAYRAFDEHTHQPSSPGFVNLFGTPPTLLEINAPNVSRCYLGVMHAQVTDSENAITITPQTVNPKCPPIRLVIKKDGSGGEQQMHVGLGEAWFSDGLDHLLTR